nr:hypothetical protein [Tanacetum cinerariifolium]
MSSPDHSTSNNEDAFSSNIPDYVSTIPDYSLASSGKPYSNASNNSIDFFPFEEISPKDTETSVSPSLSVGSSLPIRSTISPLDYPFDESIFAELDNSLWITPRPLGEEPVLEELNKMPPKRTSTSETPTITLATIQQLITDGIVAALETQAINTDDTNRNFELREPPVAKRGNYKEFLSCQRFYFNVTEGAELATLCPNMVPNTEKLMEAFIGGLPRSIEGNVTALKPQTLEKAINIAQRLMDQIIKYNSTQDTNDHKQKFDDTNTTDNNNYPNDRNNNYQNNHNNHNHNNDYHQQQNKKQETFKTYVATNGVGPLTKNCRNKRPVIGNNLRPVPVTCNACGEKGHYANQCSKENNRATGKRT